MPNVFEIDDRYLTIGDIHSMIITSFTNKEGYYDYTKVMPPKRTFNLPEAYTHAIVAMLLRNSKINTPDYATKSYNNFLNIIKENDGNFRYIKVHSLENTDGAQETLYYPFEKIGQLPVEEIVE